ncbi:methylamine utilization protein MauE [Bacillus toyonensis]|uniref:TlpA family protein disulfide reductase n=1 Tax=Bacillus toyonensis TaxID=155322 RepID=UPI000BFEA82F|nr:methylamine utilization protein MauE [Bacillus toyonensis]PHC38546.1 methylamine utilization protein MauE [Bacillus toyonensis]
MSEKWYVISNITLWIVVIFQTILILYLGRLVGQFLNRFRIRENKQIGQLEEKSLAVGQKVPVFQKNSMGGKTLVVPSDEYEYTLLLFVSNTCSSCKELFKKMPDVINKYDINYIFVSSEILDSNMMQSSSNAHFIVSSDIVEDFFVHTSPYILLVDKLGEIKHIADLSNFGELIMKLDSILEQELVNV